MTLSTPEPSKSPLNISEASILQAWRCAYPALTLSYAEADLRSPYIGTRYSADFVHLQSRVLIEVQGGTHNGGKHGRGAGILTDMTKLAVAHKNGWRLFQVPATVPQAKRIFPMIADVIVATINRDNSL